MKLFGKVEELFRLILRHTTNNTTLTVDLPATLSANRTVKFPNVSPDTQDILLTSQSQTVTNKSIDADQNTITNIEDADIKALAAIDATKIADGSVDNTEFQRLGTAGTAGAGNLVTTDGTQILSGKTIDGDDNTIQDISVSSLKTVLGDADEVIRRDAAGAVVSGPNTIPNNSTLLTTDATQTVTGKSIDADTNTITNIDNNDIKALAGIDATKIADGSVDNTEFQRLGTAGTNGAGNLVTTDGTQTVSNKTFGNTNSVTVLDTNFTIQDNLDPTKQVKFDAQGVATANTVTLQIPNLSSTLVTIDGVQSLSDKLLDSSNTYDALDTLFTVHDNIDDNKAFRFQASGITTGNTRVYTVPDANTTLVGTDVSQTITNKNLASSTNTLTGATASSFTNTGTVTLPTATTTLVGQNTTDTLTNKTFQQDLIDDYLDFNEESSPATPGSNKVRVYAKSDGKMYRKDDTGVEAELGGSGSGELNNIDNPSDATGWVASGAGVTVATTSTASDLPLAGIIETAIKITPVSGTDYVRYRWTMPEGLKNKKLKLEWHQRPLSGYASGDLKVEVYKNSASDYTGSYTEFALSTDASGTSSIPNQTGKYTTTFDSDSGDYYELRIVRVAGTTALNIANVINGPGIQPQGTVISEWQSFTPSWSNFTLGNGTQSGFLRRVGSQMEGQISFTFGSTSSLSGTLVLNIPNNLSINTAALASQTSNHILGLISIIDSGTAEHIGRPAYNNSTSLNMKVTRADGTYTTISTINGTTPMTWATGDVFNLWFNIPIAEWTGSGTVNVVQNDAEYVSNSSTSDADDTTSFVYGPAGSTTPGALSTARNKRVRFQTPIQTTDKLILEFSKDSGVTWVPVDISDATHSYRQQTTETYGMRLSDFIGSTDVDVNFGHYRRVDTGAYGAAGAAWAVGAARWRVKKIAGGNAVGFGKASPQSSGLITSYSPTVRSSVLTVNSTNYTILENDGYETILVSTGASQRTITLPAVSVSNGRRLVIKKTDSGSGTVLIDTPGSETIDGAAQNIINAQYGYIIISCDGSNWYVESAWDYLETILTGSSFSQANPVAGTWYDVSGLTLTVSPGQWTIDSRGFVTIEQTASVTNIFAGSFGLRSGTSTLEDYAQQAITFDGGTTSVEFVFAHIHLSKQVTLTTSTTYKGSIAADAMAGTGTPNQVRLRYDNNATFNYARSTYIRATRLK